MNKLSIGAKQAIIEKVLSNDGRSVAEIAKAYNVGRSTLDGWVKSYRQYGTISKQKTEKGQYEMSLSSRFEHLVATASLDEAAISIYCREKGIYSFQLTQWKEAFMAKKGTEKQENIDELKALRIENKQLKQEVRRKDTALAEATALLILKKKAALIWGEIGDD
jgi:transposase-like protein